MITPSFAAISLQMEVRFNIFREGRGLDLVWPHGSGLFYFSVSEVRRSVCLCLCLLLVCVCVCMCLSLSLSPSLSFFCSLSLSLPLSLSLSLFLSLSLSLFLSLSLSLSPLQIIVLLALTHAFSLSLSLSLSIVSQKSFHARSFSKFLSFICCFVVRARVCMRVSLSLYPSLHLSF